MFNVNIKSSDQFKQYKPTKAAVIPVEVAVLAMRY